MIKYMCLNQMHNTNVFPAKNGVSDYLSPHTIITGRVTDYDKACQVAFGAYVQGFNVSKNDQTPRTFDGIYLRPSKNKQGGHDVLNLMTGKAVNTPRVKEVPITELVIKVVERLAEKDGIKCLKITDRNDGILVTADNIAGVDFQDEAVNDDEVEEDDPPAMMKTTTMTSMLKESQNMKMMMRTKTSTTELTQQSWKICWMKMTMKMIQDPMLPTVAQIIKWQRGMGMGQVSQIVKDQRNRRD